MAEKDNVTHRFALSHGNIGSSGRENHPDRSTAGESMIERRNMSKLIWGEGGDQFRKVQNRSEQARTVQTAKNTVQNSPNSSEQS